LNPTGSAADFLPPTIDQMAPHPPTVVALVAARTEIEPRDPSRLDRAHRRWATALLFLFALGIAVVVGWPGPPDPGGQSSLKSYLSHGPAHGLPAWITFSLVESLANVLMFLPVGLLGSLAMRRRNYLVVPFAAAASGLIEMVQLIALPSRVASLQDVRANAIGALLGFLLSIPSLRRRRRSRRRYLQGRRSAADSGRRAALVAR